MEFFGYIQIPQYIMQLIRNGTGGISLDEFYIILYVAAGAFLVCLILGGLALYTMAERAGIKHSWLGFLPFANTYYAGKIAGEAPFFGRKMKRAGLYAMIAEIVYVVLEIFSLVTSVLIASPSYYETTYYEGGGSSLTLNLESVPAGIRWMASASNWFSVLALVSELVMIVFFCAVYNGLYRKYSPRNAYVMTVFSVILPVRAFILFGIRNNVPVDFNEYMKKRIEQAMQSAGVPVDEINKQEDPFSDFADKPSSAPSPFAEFDDYTPPPSEGTSSDASDDDTDGDDLNE